MQQEKVTITALARELNVESRKLLDLCRRAGIEVKTELGLLNPEQRATVERLVRQPGSGGVATARPRPHLAARRGRGDRPRPAGPAAAPSATQGVPPRGPQARREQKPAEPKTQRPIARLPEGYRPGAVNPQQLIDRLLHGIAVPPAPVVVQVEDQEKVAREGATGDKGRVKRPQERGGRSNDHERDNDTAVRGRRRTQGRKHAATAAPRQRLLTQPRKGAVPIAVPITVRSLSEALGVRSLDLLFKLREHGVNAANLNVTLDPEVAETVALACGSELDVKRAPDAEAQLREDASQTDRPEDRQPRAPVVAVLGHVDHGKTSLLDRIRRSNVAATEVGGITQVIRAWRVEYQGRPLTFLDTPGHEAFTKMRARGANVTDVAVIVVAADDGVRPQTEEAIYHARAAGVPMVVALNKVDLPSANAERARRQLYGLGVLPDNRGGNVAFVETSARTGHGIDELLENLLLVADMKDLRANPSKAGRGTCLEAMRSEGQGVVATLLIQSGTLRRGDVLLCGATFGRVRALYNDLGEAIQEAGPSVPVRVTGLDEVPNADDPFQVVADLATAREIAEKRQRQGQVAATPAREPVRLADLTRARSAELKVILKADFRGSIEAIRKELEKLRHEEVRVRILEAGIGAISESDVWLALTSPADTLVVGFNVVPDERARALAEGRGIPIREYSVIYQLTEDVRAALEGKLEPRAEVVHLGRAVVRQTFKASRIGTIAGCHVTQGLMERSARVRVIRGGVVVYPPADRSASLESLRRFKEDVREVREGFDCGLKIAAYDDVKVGDVIEAYRVEQVRRKL